MGRIDTRGSKGALFQAASLRPADGESLGKLRRILCKVASISLAGAAGNIPQFQELQVEGVGEKIVVEYEIPL